MAEVGLVRFAQVAMEVGSASLPLYSSKYSKRTFTQPQLLASLLLMRYEDWTFRELEVRLSEHSELRRALGLSRIPDHSTLHYFLRRLDEESLVRALEESVTRFGKPPAGGAVIAVDGTGLSCAAVSVFFVKRTGDTQRHYLKWLIGVEVKSRMVVAQMARRGPSHDSAQLRPLTQAAHAVMPLKRVLADAEFDSQRNYTFIREELGAMSVIPAKRIRPGDRSHGVRAEMRHNFPQELYAPRALVECVFSVVKRKLSARAPGRSLHTQRLQAFILGVAYNIYRLRPWDLLTQITPVTAQPSNSV